MIPSIGGPELIIALVIILLLFGAKKIPELAKGLGTGMREFKKGTRGEYEVEDKKKEEKDEQLASARAEEPRAEQDAQADKPEQPR
jgi:sec-independent protein translocase protein TatA